MNHKRILLKAIAVAALALPMASATAQGRTGVVKIGINEMLSGMFVTVGVPASAGVRLAVKEINDKGGVSVGGTTYKFEITEADNKSSTADAVAAMNKLVNDDKIKFVFGPTVGALASQSQEVVIPAKVINFSAATTWQSGGMLAPSSKATLLMGTQMAVSAISTIDIGAMKEYGVKKVAFISPDDETTKANMVPFETAAKAAGIEAIFILHPPKTTDYSSFVTRAGGEKVDGIYFLYPQANAPDILRAIVELKIPIKVFGGRALDPQFAVKTAIGRPLPFPFYSTLNTPSIDYPGNAQVKAFAERLRAFDPKVVGSTANFVFFSYDFMHMLAEAMKIAGTVEDTERIGKVLTSMTYSGVAGKICYNNPAMRTASLDGGLIYVRDGKIEGKTFPSSCK